VVSNHAESIILKLNHAFSKACNFSGEKCDLFPLSLCHLEVPLKPDYSEVYLCSQFDFSLPDVSKSLSSFYKAILPVVNQLLV
jgi:hypothetical protein